MPDPVVLLAGGPGGGAVEAAGGELDEALDAVLGERDLVLLDQRGVGKSEPALECPEFMEALRSGMAEGLLADPLGERSASGLASCHERLEREGVDFAGYTSAESAADLNDLRLALGYEEWNLFGGSYGTRLALTAMRDAPEGIRSVILDSVYPPQSDLYAEAPANARRAFQMLFDGCRQDPDCHARWPNLEGALFETVRRLNENPPSVSITDYSTDETLTIPLTGDLVVTGLFSALYSTEWIPALPYLIAQAEAEPSEAKPLAEFLLAVTGSLTIGMHYAVQCQEELPFTSPQRVRAADQAHPELHALTAAEPIFSLCEPWATADPAPEENQPVRSDIPALVLAGEYDPITPPSWGRLVSADLANGFFFEFPGLGHGAAGSHDCPDEIFLAFLKQPTVAPDGSCIADMQPPDFFIR
jgi:pimeloyl-ACP methyl ester carboxylesterase